MGLYRAEVTKEEFVQEMQKAYPDEYSEQGLVCLYQYLVNDDTGTIFDVDTIHKEFKEYKGLKDYNQRTGSHEAGVGEIWGALEFADLDGFIVC